MFRIVEKGIRIDNKLVSAGVLKESPKRALFRQFNIEYKIWDGL